MTLINILIVLQITPSRGHAGVSDVAVIISAGRINYVGRVRRGEERGGASGEREGDSVCIWGGVVGRGTIITIRFWTN